MSDIRIDRYDVNISGTSGTISITDVGNVNSAFVRITGSSRQDSAGVIGNTGNLGPDHLGVRLEITGTTEITYTKQNSGDTIKLMIEVWVYTGASGGAYEFISRQRGTVTVTGTNNTAAITGITERNDCVPIFTGFTTSEASNSNWEYAAMACHINSSSQVRFDRNNSGTTIVCAYDIIEFTGSAWSVGCARSASHDANGAHFSGGEVVTMNADSDGQSGSTFDVTDWGSAMIMQGTMGGDSSETGLSDTLMYFLPGPSTTQLRCTLDNSNSRNDSVSYAYIIQCDDLTVNRNTLGSITEGNNSYGTNLAAPSGYDYGTPLNEMALEWFPGTNGEGTAHARGALNAIIVDTGSAYQVRHWVHRSGNDVAVAYGLVDLSNLTTAASTTGQIKVWTGSAFEAKPMKVWNGSSWETKPVKHWNGSAWVETPY